MQTFIDKWVSVNNIVINKNKFPSIYYLKWSNSKCRPYKDIEASFQNKLSKYTFYRKVKSDSKYIYVIGKFKNQTEYQFRDCCIKHEGFLKSHLQKCIRRGLIGKSIRTAYSYMATDFQSFIRRLSIIMLEDVMLHKSITTIIWMMMAYPKWKPALEQVEWLLGVVHFLASCKKYDKISNEKVLNNTNNLDIIYSLEIRKSFGGMHGDIDMIDNYIIKWNNRFSKGEIPNEFNQKIKIVDEKSIIDLEKNDIEYAAVDFHCFKVIIRWIQDNFIQYDDEEIKKAIWYGSSGYNKRHEKNILCTCDKKYKDIWYEIKSEYYKIVKYLIKNL